MERSRLTEEQILFALKQAEAGQPVGLFLDLLSRPRPAFSVRPPVHKTRVFLLRRSCAHRRLIW